MPSFGDGYEELLNASVDAVCRSVLESCVGEIMTLEELTEFAVDDHSMNPCELEPISEFHQYLEENDIYELDVHREVEEAIYDWFDEYYDGKYDYDKRFNVRLLPNKQGDVSLSFDEEYNKLFDDMVDAACYAAVITFEHEISTLREMKEYAFEEEILNLGRTAIKRFEKFMIEHNRTVDGNVVMDAIDAWFDEYYGGKFGEDEPFEVYQ